MGGDLIIMGRGLTVHHFHFSTSDSAMSWAVTLPRGLGFEWGHSAGLWARPSCTELCDRLVISREGVSGALTGERILDLERELPSTAPHVLKFQFQGVEL